VDDKQAEGEIRQLYGQEHDNVVRADIPAQVQVLPDDFVETTPAGMLFTQPQVVQRLRGDGVTAPRLDATRAGGHSRLVPFPDAILLLLTIHSR
jgi:hypothetical protein